MVYDSPHFPKELKDKIYDWARKNLASEKKGDQTEEQFLYSARKKALGPFKKEIMSLSTEVRGAISKEIEAKFEFLFEKLNVHNTREMISKHTVLKRVITRKSAGTHVEMDGEGAD
jgi:hypothetical protein